MRINAINSGYSVNTASNLKSTKVNKVSDPIVADKTNFALISFKLPHTQQKATIWAVYIKLVV